MNKNVKSKGKMKRSQQKSINHLIDMESTENVFQNALRSPHINGGSL